MDSSAGGLDAAAEGSDRAASEVTPAALERASAAPEVTPEALERASAALEVTPTALEWAAAASDGEPAALERAAVVAALGGHFAAGRLTPGDYERQAVAAAAARRRADLVALFAALPVADGPGGLPAELREALVGEGLRFLAEDLPGELIHRRYRAPGQRIFRRTAPVRGAVGVSARRLVVWAGGAKRVDLPFADARWDAALAVSADRSGRLRVVTNVGPFHPDRSGRVECRFATPAAADIVTLLKTLR